MTDNSYLKLSDQKVWRFVTPLLLILFVSNFSIQMQGHTLIRTGEDASWYRQVLFGGIYLFAGLLAFSEKQKMMHVIQGHMAYILFVLYALSSIIWSDFPYKVFISFIHFTGYALISICAVIAFNGREKLFFKTLLIYASIALIFSILLAVLIPSRGTVLADGMRWKGIAMHPNYLGIIAIMGVWSAMNFFKYAKSKLGKAWCLTTILAGFLCLYGSNSMTSIVLSLCILISLPISNKIFKKSLSHSFTIISVLIVILLFSAGILYLFAPQILGPELIFKLMGRSSDFTGREGLWEIAHLAIAEKPVFGWGFDGLRTLSSTHEMLYSQFHNGYMDLLVRGGWFGLFMLLLLFVSTIRKLLKLSEVDLKLMATLVVMLLIILIHNITEASLMRTAHPMWLLFIVIYFYLNNVNFNLLSHHDAPSTSQKPETDLTETNGTSLKNSTSRSTTRLKT
jgi:exopolysaccharide production protein ExoQ